MWSVPLFALHPLVQSSFLICWRSCHPQPLCLSINVIWVVSITPANHHFACNESRWSSFPIGLVWVLMIWVWNVSFAFGKITWTITCYCISGVPIWEIITISFQQVVFSDISILLVKWIQSECIWTSTIPKVFHLCPGNGVDFSSYLITHVYNRLKILMIVSTYTIQHHLTIHYDHHDEIGRIWHLVGLGCPH